jgi:hypothetical protein
MPYSRPCCAHASLTKPENILQFVFVFAVKQKQALLFVCKNSKSAVPTTVLSLGFRRQEIVDHQVDLKLVLNTVLLVLKSIILSPIHLLS